MSFPGAVEKICERFDCDPKLVSALIEVESAWNPYAVRYEPGYQWLSDPGAHAKAHGITLKTEVVLQRCSWGLLQITGATARDIGFRLPLPALCETLVGLEYGVRYLKTLEKNYTKTSDLIAAYNAGSAKKLGNGKYANQAYVDKVLRAMRRGE